MTAPRWIFEAIESSPGWTGSIDAEKMAASLIERLPLTSIIDAIAGVVTAPDQQDAAALSVMHLLTDGDPEVVTLTELYQGACRVLDGAGVPYESCIADDGDQQVVRLNLYGRILWLVEQRPIRAELDSARATQKLAEEMATKYMAERDAARRDGKILSESAADDYVRLLADHLGNKDAFAVTIADASIERDRLAAERDQLRKMYDGANVDLDRERLLHQEDVASRDAEIVKLVAERDAALEGSRASDERMAGVLDGTFSVGDGTAQREIERLSTQSIDQAAYIEQLEHEIDALEDEIWEDEP